MVLWSRPIRPVIQRIPLSIFRSHPMAVAEVEVEAARQWKTARVELSSALAAHLNGLQYFNFFDAYFVVPPLPTAHGQNYFLLDWARKR